MNTEKYDLLDSCPECGVPGNVPMRASAQEADILCGYRCRDTFCGHAWDTCWMVPVDEVAGSVLAVLITRPAVC